ncbi:MAG: CAP domain-containing protein, partial [bacterium]
MRHSVLKFRHGQGRRKTRAVRLFFVETFQLERRDVPALPTNLEQEMLEWINRFRMDPGGEYDRYFTSSSPVQSPIAGVAGAVTSFGVNLTVLKSELAALSPVAPVAWNSNLNDAALGHNQKMIAQDSQQHVLPGEQDVGTRITAAGYSWSTYGENIFAYATSVAYAQAGFIIDWGSGTDGMQNPRGHRNNMISANFKELGVSITPENNPSTGVGPLVVTQDFGDRFSRTKSSVLGVIFTDANNDNFYNAGEGNTGVNVTITGAAGTFTTTSWATGGYQLDNVPAGSYTLTIAGAGISTSYWSRNITVGSSNVKSDFNLALQPKSQVGFESAAEVQVIEGNSTTITLTRSGTISDALDVTITPQNIPGSTEIWQNLIQPITNNGLVHFDPNQATATFTVTTLTDNIQRADTRINLAISFSSTRYISAIATKPVFVVNDDGSVGFDSTSDISLAEGTEAVITVRRIGPTTNPLDVTVTPQDITGSTEPWQNLIQPIANGGLISIPAGQSTATFTLKALSDSVFRATSKFNLKLTSVSASFPVSTDIRAVIYQDDDQKVGFDVSTAASVNAGQQVTINLTRVGATSQPLDVTITPQDLPGATYTWQTLISPLLGGGTVHFNANQTQASFVVTSLLDGVLRPDT